MLPNRERLPMSEISGVSQGVGNPVSHIPNGETKFGVSDNLLKHNVAADERRVAPVDHAAILRIATRQANYGQ